MYVQVKISNFCVIWIRDGIDKFLLVNLGRRKDAIEVLVIPNFYLDY